MDMIRNRGGFTLIELILVIVIVGIVASIVSRVMADGTRSFLQVDQRQEGIGAAGLALERISREAREIQRPTPSTVYITVFTSTDLRFIDVGNNDIEFLLCGSDLKRNGNPTATDRCGTADLLASGVSSLSFQYFRKDGTQIIGQGAPFDREIWRIDITLGIQVGGETVTLRSTIFPRNFV